MNQEELQGCGCLTIILLGVACYFYNKFGMIAIIVIVLIGIGIIALMIYNSGRCPKCHQKTLEKISSQEIDVENVVFEDSEGKRLPGKRYHYIDYFKCSNCGYTCSKRYKHDEETKVIKK